FFQLFTMLKMAGAPLINEMLYEATQMQIHYLESTWISNVLPNEQYMGSVAPRKSVFNSGQSCISSNNSTAFLLTAKPHFPSISIDYAAPLLIHDLCHGCHLSSPNSPLPFLHFHSWDKFCIQQHLAQDPLSLSPPQAIQAVPPSTNMPWGWANTVLI
ncbi:hypothetical protein F5J12DRAFT_680849, partial [Pisolithus orientalis]|uniref:uncharacterized protein n=1 Tax=Pisolithus orientalis TaxID=936130 RepID=UPI00222523B8